MTTPDSDNPNYEVSLTSSDIYRAAEQGVLSRDDADRLVGWGLEQRSKDPGVAPLKPIEVEQGKGLNFVTVAYYFGAMLMISACAWFLGDKWEELGSPGILVTVVIYMAVAAALGWWLRGKGYLIGGGLLITVAVCLVPLLTYSIQDILGVWPQGYPGDYERYYPWIHGSWIVMELATIAVAAVALYFVRFGFLTAPIAFSFWFLSMDLAALIAKKSDLSWETREWISVGVGLVILLVGFGLEKLLQKRAESRSEDFAFWCYVFGMMAFWGGLTSMDSNSELKKALYALLNVGFIGCENATIDISRVRSARSAYLFGPSCLPSLPGFIPVSVRAGAAWFEFDSFNRIHSATSSGPDHRIDPITCNTRRVAVE